MMSLVCGHNYAMYPIWRLTNDDDSALNWSQERTRSECIAQFLALTRSPRRGDLVRACVRASVIFLK